MVADIVASVILFGGVIVLALMVVQSAAEGWTRDALLACLGGATVIGLLAWALWT